MQLLASASFTLRGERVSWRTLFFSILKLFAATTEFIGWTLRSTFARAQLDYCLTGWVVHTMISEVILERTGCYRRRLDGMSVVHFV
jgi:hypothetical protein